MPPTDTELSSSPLTPAARMLWAALIIATLYLCYFHNLGAIGLVGPDEPRYAWIARDMAETGDWITPRLYGTPWFEKPPLYYWGAAGCFKLFGVSEVSARLPSAICALWATLTLAWLAWRIYGAETARWLLLLLPTSVGMIGFSHAAATDMPFAAMLTTALVSTAILLNLVPNPASGDTAASFLSFTSLTSSTTFISLFFGFFLGLASLAKGPAAIILSGGAVLCWAAFTKRWRDALRCLHPMAMLSFCLTALPWYILCARRNPDFFRVFIIEHNFKRFLTPEFQHIQPFWFYAPILLVAFLPWTVALLLSFFLGLFRWLPSRRFSPASLLILAWACFCVVFFTISKSKLPGYILPAIPAIGLLLARSVTRQAATEARAFRWVLVIFCLLSCVASLLLLGFAHPSHPMGPLDHALVSFSMVLVFFALANFNLAYREDMTTRLRFAAPFCVVPVLLLLCIFKLVAAPWLQYDPSGKTLAMEVGKSGIPLERLSAQPMYRGKLWSLEFYLHREIPTWDRNNPHEGYLLLQSTACKAFVNADWKCSENRQALPASGWFLYRIERSN